MQVTHLLKEDLMFIDGQLEREQTWGQCGTERVPIHQSYLRANRLVFEQMFLWRYHVG